MNPAAPEMTYRTVSMIVEPVLQPPGLTLPERCVLALLIAASAWLFWRRFGRILGRIRAAQPDTHFRLDHIQTRVKTFVWEVLLQGKVIRQRPVAGLLHALVFWAFCAFGLVTLNHVTSGFGLSLFQRQRGFGTFYYWFAFVFALGCAFAIAALAWRRFVIRPKWLEPIGYESGVIAALIFVLMVSYLAEWWVTESSAWGHALWWIHTMALVAFLPLVPHTKHLHLILSPFTLFLKHERFSDIPPLKGDEDFGLVAGKDLTQITVLQAYSCVECGRCTEHCPANNTGKELNPKLIALGIRDYVNKMGMQAEQPLLEASISQTAVFQCTTCGACEFQCPVGVQHLPMMIGLRRGAVNTGAWEDEHGTKLFLNLERKGNAMGFAPSERDKFVARQQWPIFNGSQEYCLWLGCMGAYDPNGREIVAAFAEVMKYLGTGFGILKKERCTGDPARRLGNDLVFGQLAGDNIRFLDEAGVKKIVSICPHCVRTMAEDWREFGMKVDVEHHTEFMARYADRLPKAEADHSTVFHDPCYLGRYRNVYEAPRELIQLSGKLVEPSRTRERSFCCGAGGGLTFLGEETGTRVSHNRAAELKASGASVIAAACPFCSSMFRDALPQLKDGGATPELRDVAQILAASIRALGEPRGMV